VTVPSFFCCEVLNKLLNVGYGLESKLIFGSDSNTNAYDAAWVKKWIKLDCDIYRDMNVSKDIQQGIYSENLKVFVTG